MGRIFIHCNKINCVVIWFSGLYSIKGYFLMAECICAGSDFLLYDSQLPSSPSSSMSSYSLIFGMYFCRIRFSVVWQLASSSVSCLLVLFYVIVFLHNSPMRNIQCHWKNKKNIVDFIFWFDLWDFLLRCFLRHLTGKWFLLLQCVRSTNARHVSLLWWIFLALVLTVKTFCFEPGDS